MCRPENLQPSGVRHAKPRSSAASRGQGLAHPGQPRLAPAEPPGKPSPRRPQRAGEVVAAQRPGRRWESRIASSARKATPRYRPKSASLLRRSSPPPPCCARTPEHPEEPQHRWSGKKVQRQGPGRSRHAYLQLLRLPGPVQATCPGDSGLVQTRWLKVFCLFFK